MTITIDNLSIQYDNQPILKDFSTIINPNEAIAILGPSGAGKTSIMNAILQLIPYEGQITSTEEIMPAAVFQEDRLCYGLSVYSNIKLTCPQLSKEELHHAIKRAGLTPGANVNKLSGGMRRRVAILRAILAPSNLLILDEPFKGLDSDTKNIIMEMVKEKASDKIMILITHDSSEAAFFNCRLIEVSFYS